jgi:hypothetical protein
MGRLKISDNSQHKFQNSSLDGRNIKNEFQKHTDIVQHRNLTFNFNSKSFNSYQKILKNKTKIIQNSENKGNSVTNSFSAESKAKGKSQAKISCKGSLTVNLPLNKLSPWNNNHETDINMFKNFKNSSVNLINRHETYSGNTNYGSTFMTNNSWKSNNSYSKSYSTSKYNSTKNSNYTWNSWKVKKQKKILENNQNDQIKSNYLFEGIKLTNEKEKEIPKFKYVKNNTANIWKYKKKLDEKIISSPKNKILCDGENNLQKSNEILVQLNSKLEKLEKPGKLEKPQKQGNEKLFPTETLDIIYRKKRISKFESKDAENQENLIIIPEAFTNTSWKSKNHTIFNHNYMKNKFPLELLERKNKFKVISQKSYSIYKENTQISKNLHKLYDAKSEIYKDITVRMKRMMNLKKIKTNEESMELRLGDLPNDEKQMIKRLDNLDLDRERSELIVKKIQEKNLASDEENISIKENYVTELNNESPLKMNYSNKKTSLFSPSNKFSGYESFTRNIIQASSLPTQRNNTITKFNQNILDDQLKILDEDKQKTYNQYKTNERLTDYLKSIVDKSTKKSQNMNEFNLKSLSETYRENVRNYMKHYTEEMKKKYDFLTKIENGDIIKDELEMNVMQRIIPGNYLNYDSLQYFSDKLKFIKIQPRFLRTIFKVNNPIFDGHKPKEYNEMKWKLKKLKKKKKVNTSSK